MARVPGHGRSIANVKVTSVARYVPRRSRWWRRFGSPMLKSSSASEQSEHHCYACLHRTEWTAATFAPVTRRPDQGTLSTIPKLVSTAYLTDTAYRRG